MSQPNVPSETYGSYQSGQTLGNWCIDTFQSERLEAHRAFVQRLWDETPEDQLAPSSKAYLRGQLDVIHEYQTRGDETP